jgi:hypothetical protein
MPRVPVNSAVKPLLHTDDIKIDQLPPLSDDDMEDRDSEIIKADASVLEDKAYAEELKFYEDPIVIRIEPSAEKNASSVHPVWCNGKGAEILITDQGGTKRWREVTWLPVNIDLTVKRKYVAILMSAKITRVETQVIKSMEDEENRINRITSAACTFSIISDPSPRGPEWFRQLRARNM